MNFAHPYILLSLWAVVPLALTVYWGLSRRKKILNGFAAGEGLSRLTADVAPARRTVGAILLIMAASLALVALAGPLYGFRWEKIERRGVDIMVALDCSRSMMAKDIDPTRLTRAKYEIIDLLGMLSGDRIGLVAFAGSAFMQCPLTMDYSAFHLFLESLSPDMLPVGGTDLGDAVLTAVSGFNAEDDSDKAIILITDGEQTAGADPVEAARKAADKNIKIFCIGVGNDQGAPIPESNGGFKKNREGKIVLTRLDEETLRRMAAVSGGAFVRSVAGDMDLEVIYKDKIRDTMEQKTLESGRKKIWEDRFQWFLALALLCLAVEMFLPRCRNGAVRAVMLLILLTVCTGAADARAGTVYGNVQQGRTAYEAGQYEKALKHFIDAQLADPDNGELYYNIGSAYYKTGKFDEAADNFKKSLDLFKDKDNDQSQGSQRTDAWYNLGNAYYRQQLFKDAIDAYQKALSIDAEDKEARDNLDLAKKALEEQKKQHNRQQQQGDKQQNQKEDQQNKQQGDQQQQKDDNQQQGDQKDKQQASQQQKKQNQDDQGRNGNKQNGDQSQTGAEKEQSAAGDKNQPDQPDETRRQKNGGDHEPERHPAGGQNMKQDEQQPGRAQQGTLSRLPDQGEKRLDRLQDIPGGALIMPDYRKREVEQDW